MPRGGSRQGTPGKGYANRTDLQSKPDMGQNTAATGGGIPVGGPSSTTNETRQAPPPAVSSPEDTPNMSDPTNRPDEPVTAGLKYGPGPGMEAMAGFDPRIEETRKVNQKWGPILRPLAEDPETPASVRTLVRYMRGM